ncbi:hypothetical protein HDF26_003641 [Pedobacter cryoconitis]|uniref:Lipoprotein n=1 Tax=Pedobacter cryoconitis TaxID=188932 RepID=A0A7W9DZ58_9SPHI|nr:hypothetical protein [Pedobacter cryoconitis]MBB5635919.1 hypothetical protein [Pedobacter cryoconitis]MBB6273181.1 hypothetical protein [Pedobacter cryoconitis]
MKKIYPVLLLALATLLVQCKKSAQEELEVSGSKSSKTWVNAAPTSFCASCQESPNRINGNEADVWAAKFAPLLKFDRAAPEYPTSVEDVWANTLQSSIVCGGKLVFEKDPESRSMDFPTYYDVQAHPTDPNRIFIEYWWAYKRQRPCFGNLGGHNYDLEHMVIQIDKQSQRVVTVTYFQHKGWFTKNWRSTTEGKRVEAYVGKIAHGLYHDSRSKTIIGFECSYYGDYRNPDGSKDEVLTSKNLVRMGCNKDEFSFNGDWGIGPGPLYRDRNYWNYTSCVGNNALETNGCAACDFGSEKKIGDL